MMVMTPRMMKAMWISLLTGSRMGSRMSRTPSRIEVIVDVMIFVSSCFLIIRYPFQMLHLAGVFQIVKTTNYLLLYLLCGCLSITAEKIVVVKGETKRAVFLDKRAAKEYNIFIYAYPISKDAYIQDMR